jgi:signal transduction histidine kinase
VRELADHEIEFFAQKLRHEFKRGATVLQISIANLKSAAQQRVVDRERVLSEVATLSTVAQLLLSVVSSACDVAEVAPSRFKQENLRALVAQAVHLLAEQIGRERLDVELDVDDGLTLDVDRGKLLQAFLNVLHNAAEAYSGDSAERIKIGIVGRVVRGGTQVVVTFTDQGCGIGADELPHVFAPFGTSKTREPRVRGLGLLNVKRMIESGHGGEVRIESTKGVGTSVTVLLPRQQKA